MAGRRINPDEEALWQEITDSVKPLDPNRRNQKTETDDPVPEATATQSITSQQAKKKKLIPPHEPRLHPPGPVNPDAGVDKRTLGRLKKGKMAIDARIDLHGHTRESAYRALCGFIESAYDRQNRCVLVITGKGLRASEGREGVLKQAVPEWFSGSKLKPMIVSWQPAQPRDGGSGALYVLIKRRR